MKVERVSYDVMTPSAARGVLEAVIWKPAIVWRVTRIDVLKPVRWESVRRNEVNARMSDRADGIFVDDPRYRAQRAGLLLRDVAYTVHACFEMTERAGPEDNIKKFEEMFLRRAQAGQCFHRPYLGCREFAAHFEPVFDGDMPTPVDESRDLGWMLYDVGHDNSRDSNHVHSCTDKCRASFFRASLEKGVLHVPAHDGEEVRR
jgi:CRISPR-associated protein Cas5d